MIHTIRNEDIHTILHDTTQRRYIPYTPMTLTIQHDNTQRLTFSVEAAAVGTGMRACGHAGTKGCGDGGTKGCGDAGTEACGE